MSMEVAKKCLQDSALEAYMTNPQTWSAPSFSESVTYGPNATMSSFSALCRRELFRGCCRCCDAEHT